MVSPPELPFSSERFPPRGSVTYIPRPKLHLGGPGSVTQVTAVLFKSVLIKRQRPVQIILTSLISRNYTARVLVRANFRASTNSALESVSVGIELTLVKTDTLVI